MLSDFIAFFVFQPVLRRSRRPKGANAGRAKRQGSRVRRGKAARHSFCAAPCPPGGAGNKKAPSPGRLAKRRSRKASRYHSCCRALARPLCAVGRSAGHNAGPHKRCERRLPKQGEQPDRITASIPAQPTLPKNGEHKTLRAVQPAAPRPVRTPLRRCFPPDNSSLRRGVGCAFLFVAFADIAGLPCPRKGGRRARIPARPRLFITIPETAAFCQALFLRKSARKTEKTARKTGARGTRGRPCGFAPREGSRRPAISRKS